MRILATSVAERIATATTWMRNIELHQGQCHRTHCTLYNGLTTKRRKDVEHLHRHRLIKPSDDCSLSPLTTRNGWDKVARVKVCVGWPFRRLCQPQARTSYPNLPLPRALRFKKALPLSVGRLTRVIEKLYLPRKAHVTYSILPVVYS